MGKLYIIKIDTLNYLFLLRIVISFDNITPIKQTARLLVH